MKTRIVHHVAIYLFIALTGYGIGACRQNVMLSPNEEDLLVLNGCVISACNYLAAVKTQHTLEKNFLGENPPGPLCRPSSRSRLLRLGNGRNDLWIRSECRRVPYSGLHAGR